jgi:putative tryptophan/tyrosine transport system substrate-binding protein
MISTCRSPAPSARQQTSARRAAYDRVRLLDEGGHTTRTLGLSLHVLNASTDRDFDAVFASLAKLRAGAVVIGVDAFFNSCSDQLAALANRHAVPTVSAYQEFSAAGGLMSYGGGIVASSRLAGVYAGRILKGEKPADLPVMQSTEVSLVINLKTAKALGISVPATLLARAD